MLGFQIFPLLHLFMFCLTGVIPQLELMFLFRIEVIDVGWHKPVTIDLSDALKVLATGYCGLDCHNLWLKNVDERVRLKKKTVDNIYVPYMEKLFGEKIIRGRSYRRVRFP